MEVCPGCGHLRTFAVCKVGTSSCVEWNFGLPQTCSLPASWLRALERSSRRCARSQADASCFLGSADEPSLLVRQQKFKKKWTRKRKKQKGWSPKRWLHTLQKEHRRQQSPCGPRIRRSIRDLCNLLDCVPAAHRPSASIVKDCIGLVVLWIDDRRLELCC